jgi:hypothetical protein
MVIDSKNDDKSLQQSLRKGLDYYSIHSRIHLIITEHLITTHV